MKILLTGGAGFIGSNLALALQDKYNRITIVDDFSSGDFNNLKGFKGDVLVADIASIDLSSMFDGFDIIFHQASITDTTVTDQGKMIGTNVEGFRNILNFAFKHKSKVIYASSAAVYGNGNVPMKETQNLDPLNSYGFSKYLMDNLATRYTNDNPDMTIIGLRYFNVFGPREQHKGKSSSMIYQLAQQMLQSKRPRIFKDGEQKRDHIYVKDVVSANFCAIDTDKSGIVNIGTGVTTTFNEAISILNKNLGKSYEPEYFENPYSFFQVHTQANPDEAKKLLGFESQYDVKDGIADYFKYLGIH